MTAPYRQVRTVYLVHDDAGTHYLASLEYINVPGKDAAPTAITCWALGADKAIRFTSEQVANFFAERYRGGVISLMEAPSSYPLN